MIIFPRFSPIIIDWTIPSSIENIHEKGSEEVPYSNEWSTHTIGESGFGFAAQARKIDCYASSMQISGITLVLLSTSELLVILLKSDDVEEIMLQVSTLATSAKSDGDGSEGWILKETYTNTLK